MSDDPTLFDSLTKKVRELSDSLENLSFSFWKKTGSSSNSIESPRIQSVDFVTGANGNGWAIDGNGNAEFNSGNFRGDISGATGTFSGTLTGGSLNIPDATTANSFHVNTTGDSWWGATTFAAALASISKAGAAIFGNITATGGTIGGTTVTPTELYGGIIKTAATVEAGSAGVIMDSAGLRGYDAVLGNTFNLPTNGSVPTFSSGKITETVFEISTNAVMRTSPTTGDGTANSAGVLINNTGLYGLVANQVPAAANVRILNTGTAYFGNATNYMNWDGTYLKLKGSFDVGTGGLINNAPYTFANLPVAPTIVGWEVAAANEIGNKTLISTSAASPGTMADDDTVGTTVWSNPDNAKISDTEYALADSVSAADTHYLKATNFGFSVPTDAIISGILIEIKRRSIYSDAVVDNIVKIVKSDGTFGTTNKARGDPWYIEDYDSYGSSSDLWGETWTPADINNSNFGVVISAHIVAWYDNAEINHIRTTVYYTVPFIDSGNIYVSNNTYATVPATNGVLTVEVSKDGGATYGTALTQTFTGSDSLLTYGAGATELWGASYTRADMVDANFRVRLSHGNYSQTYKTFGFATGTEILTGIEIAVEAKYAASTISIDLLEVKIYYGTSVLPVQAGSQAYDSTNNTLAIYTGASWIDLGTGADLASTTVSGIVEEATAAEVLAGTAAGATGARLFVNPSTAPRTQFATTQVFSGNAPTSYTDLDLSSVVGVAQRMVYLRIEGNGTNSNGYAFRRKGEASAVGYSNLAIGQPGGVSLTYILSGAYIAHVIVPTNTSGVIEWISANAYATTINVEAYW